jgi:stage III sporulation protein AE
MVFVGYISLSGIISSAGDVAAIKTTKTVISNTVPIVGSIISDTSDAILSGANILKASIGVYGVLGVCALCLVPFIGSLANYLVFKVTSAISASLCNLSAIKAVDGIATAYGLALASLATCCALQFITIVVTSVVTYL